MVGFNTETCTPETTTIDVISDLTPVFAVKKVKTTDGEYYKPG